MSPELTSEIRMFKVSNKFVVIACCLFVGFSSLGTQPSASSIASDTGREQQKRISTIIIEGNKFVPEEAIRARIAFQQGDLFSPAKTGEMIRNLSSLNFFSQVTIETEDISPTETNLYVIVQEKKKVESVTFEGNVALTQEDIEKELKLSQVAAMDEEELELFAHKIKALYIEKNYHRTTVSAKLCPTDRGTYTALFTICDGPRATVKRVFFDGNICIPSHILRKMIFTRESWLFGFMNKAGTYKVEMLDVDKFIIENYYQSNGFLAARVVDINVDIDEATQDITVTYYVEEGPVFTVTSIAAPGNDILTEGQLLSVLPITAGQLYSKEFIRESIDRLRNIWGKL